ncbi:hypothetical protein DAPPUDRAFT_106209 [Daphnia pulex]|uniref:Uncharacterized protein n=1 Tax=Daphnia pulex TaxID=6669 RepID=E9GTE6_DAPPU|nr:hypothetical protein DAPPUDRAFT_106209 [Daphnia pulex]|eukprot:EFX77373.1 hypothetical protein DAPPUDRAFT_106209 [Daphnia pulex]
MQHILRKLPKQVNLFLVAIYYLCFTNAAQTILTKHLWYKRKQLSRATDIPILSVSASDHYEMMRSTCSVASSNNSDSNSHIALLVRLTSVTISIAGDRDLPMRRQLQKKIAPQEAVRMSKRIFEDYSKQYTFSRTTEKRKSSMRRDTSTQKKPRSDNVPSNVGVGPSTAAAVESATTVAAAATEQLTRKGKTLHECVMKWFRNTKLFVEKKIAYLPYEFEIIAESSSIKCLKCNSIIKTDVDENGCWEINRFENFRSRFFNVAKVDRDYDTASNSVMGVSLPMETNGLRNHKGEVVTDIRPKPIIGVFEEFSRAMLVLVVMAQTLINGIPPIHILSFTDNKFTAEDVKALMHSIITMHVSNGRIGCGISVHDPVHLDPQRDYVSPVFPNCFNMLKVWRHSCITRLWRYWITSDKAYTLANIFMTLNVYLCAEFNAHALVLIILSFKDKLLPWFQTMVVYQPTMCKLLESKEDDPVDTLLKNWTGVRGPACVDQPPGPAPVDQPPGPAPVDQPPGPAPVDQPAQTALPGGRQDGPESRSFSGFL